MGLYDIEHKELSRVAQTFMSALSHFTMGISKEENSGIRALEAGVLNKRVHCAI